MNPSSVLVHNATIFHLFFYFGRHYTVCYSLENKLSAIFILICSRVEIFDKFFILRKVTGVVASTEAMWKYNIRC